MNDEHLYTLGLVKLKTCPCGGGWYAKPGSKKWKAGLHANDCPGLTDHDWTSSPQDKTTPGKTL